MTHLKDKYYMELALAEATKALESGEFPVGCVIVFNDSVVASGSRIGTASHYNMPSEIDHAEIRALKAFENITTNDTAINIVPKECSLYCTMEPCLMCFGAIILSGIKKVFYAFEDPMGGGTGCDLKTLPTLYRDSDITVTPHILRDESLKLFARFFSRKNNYYWKNSLLEKYTLEQANLINR